MTNLKVEKELNKYQIIDVMYATSFVTESNLIEGITRSPTDLELLEHIKFYKLTKITIPALEHFISVYQPGTKLRDKKGLDVKIGKSIPISGGSDIRRRLIKLLDDINNRKISPYEAYISYELLHPFMDCNGRSGRALWQWLMYRPQMTFLRQFHHQAIQYHEQYVTPLTL